MTRWWDADADGLCNDGRLQWQDGVMLDGWRDDGRQQWQERVMSLWGKLFNKRWLGGVLVMMMDGDGLMEW